MAQALIKAGKNFINGKLHPPRQCREYVIADEARNIFNQYQTPMVRSIWQIAIEPCIKFPFLWQTFLHPPITKNMSD